MMIRRPTSVKPRQFLKFLSSSIALKGEVNQRFHI